MKNEAGGARDHNHQYLPGQKARKQTDGPEEELTARSVIQSNLRTTWRNERLDDMQHHERDRLGDWDYKGTSESRRIGVQADVRKASFKFRILSIAFGHRLLCSISYRYYRLIQVLYIASRFT